MPGPLSEAFEAYIADFGDITEDQRMEHRRSFFFGAWTMMAQFAVLPPDWETRERRRQEINDDFSQFFAEWKKRPGKN